MDQPPLDFTPVNILISTDVLAEFSFCESGFDGITYLCAVVERRIIAI